MAWSNTSSNSAAPASNSSGGSGSSGGSNSSGGFGSSAARTPPAASARRAARTPLALAPQAGRAQWPERCVRHRQEGGPRTCRHRHHARVPAGRSRRNRHRLDILWRGGDQQPRDRRATTISVTDVGNGKTYSASVVGYNRTKDIAVLQLHGASGLNTATIGNSSSCRWARTSSASAMPGDRWHPQRRRRHGDGAQSIDHRQR